MAQSIFTDEELTLLETITGKEAVRFLTDSKTATGSEALNVIVESRKLQELHRKVQGLCLERGRS